MKSKKNGKDGRLGQQKWTKLTHKISLHSSTLLHHNKQLVQAIKIKFILLKINEQFNK